MIFHQPLNLLNQEASLEQTTFGMDVTWRRYEFSQN